MLRSMRLTIRLFFEGAFLSYIALFRWLRPMTYAASKALMPVAQILFFTFLGTFANGPDVASFYIIGNAMQMTAINGIYGVTMSIGGDRQEGTLTYLFAAPGNRLVIFLGRAFFHVVDGALGVVLGLIFGVLFLRLDLSQANLPMLGLTILIATLSTVGLGLLLGAISLLLIHTFFINNTFYFLLLIFSGANVPLETLPGWIKTISAFLPLSRGIAAARLIIDGAPPDAVGGLLLGELAVGAAYTLLGYAVFRAVETLARRHGTLEAM